MQKSLILVAFITVMNCSTPPKETPSLAGAYDMTNQNETSGDGTVVDMEGVIQLKIYTDNHMMYVQFNENNSTASFGIGTYTAAPGAITENVIYSASDSVINEPGGNFDLEIEMMPNGYKQAIDDMDFNGEKIKLSESYQIVGTGLSSPLDGTWREIKTYNIVDGDTSDFPLTQYKAYYSGYFMYGHTFKDATLKAHTGMGFGSFEMVSDNKVKEVVSVSTYEGSSGRTFDIDVEFNGPDEYKQTITDSTGVQNVEVYERLKK